MFWAVGRDMSDAQTVILPTQDGELSLRENLCVVGDDLPHQLARSHRHDRYVRRNCLSVDSKEKRYFREARQKAPSCQNVLGSLCCQSVLSESNTLIVGEVG